VTALIVIAIVIVVVLFYGIAIYNSLVEKRARCEEAWSGIEVQLKRRHNLIPNLVETVKGYAAHESETLENVIRARNSAISADSNNPSETATMEGVLTGALRQIFALSEAYPDLKANTNFLDLQEQLQSIEDEIQMSRRFYNGTARDYNVVVDSFPSNIVAGQFTFEKRDYFELDPTEAAEVRKVPKVSF